MKTKALILFLVLLAASLAFAQQGSQTTPPPAGAQAAPARPAMTPEQRAAHRKQMQEQMQQHMQAMHEQMEKAKATLQQMKDNLPKITDPAAKQQAQLDINMWQTLVDHMSMMMEHMGPGMMGGPGMGMMGQGGMMGAGPGAMAGCPCCDAMHHDDDHGPGCCAGMAHGDMKGDMKGGCCCGGAGGMKCAQPAPDKSGGMDKK